MKPNATPQPVNHNRHYMFFYINYGCQWGFSVKSRSYLTCALSCSCMCMVHIEDHATNHPFLCFFRRARNRAPSLQIPGVNPVAIRCRLRGSDFWPICADRPVLVPGSILERSLDRNIEMPQLRTGDNFGASSLAHNKHFFRSRASRGNLDTMKQILSSESFETVRS